MTITHRESLKDLAVSAEDSQPQKKGRKNPNWPSLLERTKWATERTASLGLRGVEAAILKHVCFVDGIGLGFFQNQETTMQETGWSHTAVSRALASLTEKGLLEAERRVGRTTKYSLIGLATMPSEPNPLEDGGYPLEGYGVVPLEDGGYPLEGQQNHVPNKEYRTLISPPELLRGDEVKNTSQTGDQDQESLQLANISNDPDKWEPPELAPKLFLNGMAYAKFQEAFQGGKLTRDWAYQLSLIGGVVTREEIWTYETWFNDTYPITATTREESEKLVEDNVRRFEEARGLAPGEAA